MSGIELERDIMWFFRYENIAYYKEGKSLTCNFWSELWKEVFFHNCVPTNVTHCDRAELENLFLFLL